MERTQKVEWLRRFRLLDSEIQACRDELCFWRERAGCLVERYGEKTGQGGTPPDMGDVAAQIMDLETELRRQMEELISCRQAIRGAIEEIEDARLRHVLVLRYIEGLTLEDAADRMFYSWRQAQRLHGQALDQLVVPEGVD